MKLNTLIITLLFFVIISCTNSGFYSDSIKNENANWNSKQVISFQYKCIDTASNFNTYINIRNNTDYKYNNLYLFVSIVAPNEKIINDTVQLRIADDNGKWIGKGLSRLKNIRLKYKENIKFTQIGTYTFNIRQAMRDTSLIGIEDIGIRISKK